MKKILALVLCALLVLALVACGGEKKSVSLDDASAALDVHLASLKAKDFAATNILADTAYANEDAAMLDAMYTNFDYVITDSVIDGDTATVKADIEMVDMGAAFAAYLGEAMVHAADADWDADGSYFMELLKKDDATTKTFSVTVNMVKDAEGAWALGEDNAELYDALTGGLVGSLEGLGAALGQ